jgi:NitT/TauT family transport system substrate-binding protein
VNNRSLVDGFLAAGAQARALMEASDDEWLRLKPILNAEDEVEFKQLKNAYRQGIIGQPSNIQRAAMAQLYRILAEIGGFGMVGATTEIPPGTFW